LTLAATTKHQLQLIACAFNANSAIPQVCDGKQLATEADERADNMFAPLTCGVATDNTTPVDAREEL
jgi:hypothetical protein